MKTLHVLATLAAVAAFALLPFVFEITASIVVAGCFVAIACADYSRTRRRRYLPATVSLSVASRSERFGLAA